MMSPRLLFALFLAGGCGTVARYLMTVWGVQVSQRLSLPYPVVGTLAVNVLGSFAIGVVYGLASKNLITGELRTTVAAGLLGGFTTFSAFAFETVELGDRGGAWMAVGYALVSVIAAVLAAIIGARVTGAFS